MNPFTPDDTRQTAVVLVAVTAVLTAGVGAAFALTSFTGTAQASVQVDSFSVPDTTVEQAEVGGVMVEWFPPSGAITWSDAPAPVQEVTITMLVENPSGEMTEARTWTCTPGESVPECSASSENDGRDGQVDDMSEMMVPLENAGWDARDFEPAPGETVEHDVEFVVEVEVSWEGGSTVQTASDSATFGVTHPENESTSGGSDPGGSDSGGSNSGGGANVTLDFGEAAVDIREPTE